MMLLSSWDGVIAVEERFGGCSFGSVRLAMFLVVLLEFVLLRFAVVTVSLPVAVTLVAVVVSSSSP